MKDLKDLREPIKFISNEIWENKIGKNSYDNEKKTFWRRNNLDLFPVELIPYIKGNFMQIRNTLDALQNSSICCGIIENNNFNYRYDHYGRLINITFNRTYADTNNFHSTDIEYTEFGKIVTSINKNNYTSKNQLGTKTFHRYYFDPFTKERKEVKLSFSLNKRNSIFKDIPAQIIYINDVVRSIKVGNHLCTLFDEYGNEVYDKKSNSCHKMENFYDEYGNRFKCLTHDIETSKITEITFQFDENGNQVFCSLIPHIRYYFEYYFNSIGKQALYRVRNHRNEIMIEFPKF